MRVSDRVRLVGFLLVGLASVAAILALVGWNYMGAGRDPAVFCRSKDGGLEYACGGEAVPKDKDARGCKAYTSSNSITFYRCARRDR